MVKVVWVVRVVRVVKVVRVIQMVCPVLESMRPRNPGLQAPTKLAGFKIKNTYFSPLINSFSFRDMMENIVKNTRNVCCFYWEGNAIKPVNLKLVAKYMLLQAPSNLKNRRLQGQDSRTGMVWVVRVIQGVQVVQVVSVVKVVGDVRAIQVVQMVHVVQVAQVVRW